MLHHAILNLKKIKKYKYTTGTSLIKFFIGIIFQKMRMEEDKNVNKKFLGQHLF